MTTARHEAQRAQESPGPPCRMGRTWMAAASPTPGEVGASRLGLRSGRGRGAPLWGLQYAPVVGYAPPGPSSAISCPTAAQAGSGRVGP
jgi:hypothetical protein